MEVVGVKNTIPGESRTPEDGSSRPRYGRGGRAFLTGSSSDASSSSLSSSSGSSFGLTRSDTGAFVFNGPDLLSSLHFPAIKSELNRWGARDYLCVYGLGDLGSRNLVPLVTCEATIARAIEIS
ncbi:hypothetical protein ACFE04_004327 [Oxalis oulophora]